MSAHTIRVKNLSVAGMLLALCYSLSDAQEPVRRVAVTIDDLPTVNIVGDTESARHEVTRRLLASLGSRGIPAIGFVNESKLYDTGVLVPERLDLLREWLGALAHRLAGIGYQFVSLDAALEDQAYASNDAYIGPGGITWIHRWAITRDADPAMFRGEPTTPDYVLQLTELPEHNY